MNTSHKIMTKEVVVVLPVFRQRVLMQLRDFKPEIDVPGCWGFFGGAIDPPESPLEAASREIREEIGFKPTSLHFLGAEKIWDLEDIFAHAFSCLLTTPIQSLILAEGQDCALLSIDDIIAHTGYSKKLAAYFPTVPTYFLEKMVRRAIHMTPLTSST